MKDGKVIEDLMKKVYQEPAEPVNIEIETAGRNIRKIETLPIMDTTLYAICNERSIIRIASQIEKRLESFTRDYSQMLRSFQSTGETAIYNITNDLPELKTELRGHKEARNFYAELLQ